MIDYDIINVNDYVKKCILNDGYTFEASINLEMFPNVIARRGIFDEKVVTYDVDDSGNEVIDRVEYVQRNKKNNEVDFVLTRVNEDGTVYIDKFKNAVHYRVDYDSFVNGYEVVNENGVYRKKPESHLLLEARDNVILRQPYNYKKVSKGDFINITDKNNMYGITKEEFNKYYINAVDKKVKSK